MTATLKFLLAWVCLQLPLQAYAERPRTESVAAPVPEADRYALRCQSRAPHRTVKPQGTMLWGTRRDWDTEKVTDERSSVLVSASLKPLRRADAQVTALKLEGGHLVATSTSFAPGTPEGSRVIGAVLQGTASDGKPVEVAICGAEPSPEDPGMVWYRIEAWNALAQEWENPCVALDRVPDPRALAVRGVWDSSGTHREVPGQLTFACENGAITKCIHWGYKPWASREGQTLAGLHQACTRMARADYCGNGRSHTHEDTGIDMYDRLGVIARTTESSAEWDLARASFEAAWAPDGATCLARTRDGRALETILQECPDRFRADAALDLGEGDRCTVRRVDVNPRTALLRNQSYGPRKAAVSPASGL
ncbi:ADYC domain-containing protein [Stigmatella sp. ncwal1]|uniref:ADYC domain-containing protein n=1 Tax=Stigmatella ashevillensis TaxID=2995309 RepID=A0ABT5D4D1_9BACT|nr:ADYC domain-containing protein [Stigmatella ashevillena]MDC0708426.1 ADYC domain-containing protein [Stigmatella ashevillena]